MNFDNTFSKFLKEDVEPHLPSPGNADVGYDQWESKHFLEMINSVLTALTESPAFNPYYMVERIKDRVKLATGLSFDDVYFVGNTGSFQKNLTPVMNIALAHTADLSHVTDNGFLNKFPEGLAIKFTFLKSDNLYNVHAEIVKGSNTQTLVSETN